MQETMLSLEDVTYTYPGAKEPALRKIDLAVARGEFVGVVGCNGSGRSTLCQCLNGLIPLSVGGKLEGRVVVRGQDTAGRSTAEIAQWVGLVFSDPEAQLSQLTVAEETAFGLCNLGVPKEQVLETVERILRVVQLDGLGGRSPFALSGGQQQRVAIGSVLAMDPEVLVLDEPTSNLDPEGTNEVFSIVADLNRHRKTTVVMVEHEVELLAEYASRIVVMDQGTIVADGRPEEVFGLIETLASAQVRMPQVAELACSLERRGTLSLSPYPVTLERACALLSEALASTEGRERACLRS